LVCSWSCNAGYISVSYSEAAFKTSAFTALGYTDVQAPQVFHVASDYCCNPTVASTAGTYLAGCTRSSEGYAAVCPALPLGKFFFFEIS